MRGAFDFAVAPECLFRFIYMPLRIHWILLTFLKISNKSVWGNVLHVKVYIFWKFIQYTIHWGKNRMLKKISFEQNKRYKKCTLFSITSSNSSQLYFQFAILIQAEAHVVRLSKTVCGIFHFWFPVVFVKLFFLFNKKHGLFDFKTS